MLPETPLFNIFIADPENYNISAHSILRTLSHFTINKKNGSCSSGVLRGKCINNILPDGAQSSPRGVK